MPDLTDFNDIEIRDVSFHSGEFKLKGRLHLPRGRARAVVIINGATGVPAAFYGAFARWLADTRELACLIYDYRGYGWSSVSRSRARTILLSDWAVHDAEAAREFATATLPNTPVWLIGHSLGALCIPFQRDLDRIDRIIAVASGTVHTTDHPWPYQAMARLFWFGPGPLSVLFFGRLPGTFFGFSHDIPSKAYWQWRHWCTHRSFFADHIGTTLPYPDWNGVTAPMKFVAVADDDMTPPASVWRLMRCYPQAPKTQLTMRPQDYGVLKIGHMGAFSKTNSAVWPDILS